jgi:hypothetical protein
MLLSKCNLRRNQSCNRVAFANKVSLFPGFQLYVIKHSWLAETMIIPNERRLCNFVARDEAGAVVCGAVDKLAFEPDLTTFEAGMGPLGLEEDEMAAVVLDDAQVKGKSAGTCGAVSPDACCATLCGFEAIMTNLVRFFDIRRPEGSAKFWVILFVTEKDLYVSSIQGSVISPMDDTPVPG